jgi:hypothetical protein
VLSLCFVGIAVLLAGCDQTDRPVDGRTPDGQLASLQAELEASRDRLADTDRTLTKTRDEYRKARRALRLSQECTNRYFAHVWLTPSSGPAGTEVSLFGDCFLDPSYDSEREIRAGFGLFLTRTSERSGGKVCELNVGLSPFSLRVRNGRAQGHFVIGERVTCAQTSGKNRRVPPGLYRLNIGCHACSTSATFRVTKDDA